MKITLPLVLGVVHIAICVGLGIASVGVLPGPSKPYGWDIPGTILALLSTSFVLGFMAGRTQGKSDG